MSYLINTLVFCLIFVGGAAGQDSARIATVVADHVLNQGFSGTVLVARDGAPIYQQSFGLAYRPANDSIRNDYHYSVASVTKLFTAIRILQLAEIGEIDLSRPAAEYLVETGIDLPIAITPHHLLLHTSGLPNGKTSLFRQELPPVEVVERTLKLRPKAKFGEFNYKNVDYVLLGLIIEAVTGNAWKDEICNAILEPLGMEETGFLRYGYYPRNFAYTYSYDGGKKAEQDPFFYIENFYAAGCMYATAADLLRLDQALYDGTLLKPETYALLAESRLKNYAGYSVWNYSYPFRDDKPTVMERRGGILGANVVLVRLTDTRETIIILSNDDRFNPDSFGDPTNLREVLIRALE